MIDRWSRGAAAALLLLSACNAPHDASADAKSSRAAVHPPNAARLAANVPAEADCGFVRKKAHPAGEQLVREFLRRDAEGQFLQTDAWFDGATTCPGLEPGPDEYRVTDASSTRVLKRDAYEVAVVVTSHVAGDVDGYGFCPAPRTVVDTVTAVNTPFGWRIRSPALRQMVAMEASRRRGDLHPKAASDTGGESARCP